MSIRMTPYTISLMGDRPILHAHLNGYIYYISEWEIGITTQHMVAPKTPDHGISCPHPRCRNRNASRTMFICNPKMDD